MNEKALQQLYVLAQGDGYSKSFDDFKQLMSENENAINQMYGLAQNDGYTKDVEQFKTLVGFGGAVGGDAMVSEAVEQVKKKDEPESLVSEEFALPNTPESFVPSPESDSLSEDGTPIEVEKNPYDGTLLDEQPANFFDESLAGVNADLIDYEEEYVVPKLNYQFNDYGFTFAETGIGDGMKVKAANGNEHYTNLDPFWGEKGEAEALQKFLKENRAENQIIIDQSTAIIENKRKIDNEEQIINTVKAFNEESKKFESDLKEYALYKNKLDNLYKKNFSNVTKEQLNSDPVLKANFEQWVSAKEASNKVLEDLKKQNQDFERKGAKLDQMAGEYYEMASEQGAPGGAFVNALLDGSARFGTTAMNVMTDAATYFTPNRGMGERDYKSEIARVALENGSFEEGKFRETYPESKIKNGMVEVLDPELGTPKMIPIETFPSVYDLSKEDLIKELGGDTNDSKFLGQTLLQTALALRLGKAAYSIPIVEETEFDKANAKVMDLVRKGIKEFESYDQAVEGRYRNPFSSTAQGTDVTLGMLDAGRRGMREVLGSDNTTKQWSDTAKEGFWGGALLGLTESLPAMIGGSSPAGWAQRTAQMYAQVTDHVYEEMEENAAFDNVTESEKSMVAVPIGVAVGTLEAIGFRNVIGQKGLLNGVVSRALRKSTKNTTAKSFGEFIRQDVESMIGRGILTVGAGGLAEYETGALQEAAELTIKDIYNDVKGKDMFRTPETWKDWITQVNRAGMQEAIGGFILGTPGGVANAVSGLQVQKLDNRIYEMFEFMTKDENYTKMYVTKLKQKIADSNDPKTKKEAQEELALVKRLQGILPRIPSDYNTNQRKEALQLIFQKESLESQIKSEDDVLSKPKQDLLNRVNDRLAGLVGEVNTQQQQDKTSEQKINEFQDGKVVDDQSINKPGNVTVEEQSDIDSFFNETEDSSEVKGQNIALNRSEDGSKNTNPFRSSVIKIADLGAKAISKVLPNVRIVMHETNEQYLKYAKLGDGRAEYNPDNTTIHINLSKATKTTVPHEIFHAVLMEKVKTDPAIARAAEQMVLSVQKVVPKDSALGKRIEAFAKSYEGEFQNEERLAELVGILSSEYRQLDKPSKNVIVEFLKNIARKFGIEIGNDFGAKDADVIDLLNVISRKTRKGEVIEESDIATLEELDNGTNPIGNPTTIVKPKGKQQKLNFKDSYPLSLVTAANKIDIDALIDEIAENDQKVWFWVADQLGLDAEMDIDAGPSYALQQDGVAWASSFPVTKLEKNINNSDYIFIISGSPTKSHLFNKKVYDAYINKLGDYNTFKKNALKTKPVKGVKDVLTEYDSWESIKEADGSIRKNFLIAHIKQEKTPNTEYHKLVKGLDGFIDPNSMRDGFYKENDFKQNDIMLVLKPTGVQEGSSHSTYSNTILGDVVGIPDTKIDAFELMPKEMRDSMEGSGRTTTSQKVAPYGSGVRKVTSRKQRQQKIDKALSKSSGTTQVATTTGSYVKAADIVNDLEIEGEVLDYGAGLGLGTDAMSQVLGTEVDSYELNPERWKGKKPVTYTKASDINKQYDAIVSLNVLNVVPKDVRDFIVEDIYENLKPGGVAVISSRGFKGDIANAKNFEKGPEDKSYIIKRKKGGEVVDVYQKGFDGNELVEYVQDLLGDKVNVYKKNTFGNRGIIIEKIDDTESKPKGRQQKSVEQIAQYYGMNIYGFLPKQVDLYRLKKDLPPGIGVKQSRVDQYGRGGSYYLTNSRGYKINPYKNKGRQQKDIESYIVEARRNNFRDDVIKDFLVRVKKFPAKLVNQLMALDVDLFDQMPKSFGNVKGGAQVGLALYQKVDAYRKKLQKSNNKRKNKLSEQQILDKTIEFLEQQKEYIAEADAKTKGISTQQAQMLSDLQSSLGIRPSQNLGQKIAQARLFLRQRRKGAKDLQKIKTEVRNFIRKSLPKELYSKGEVIKLIDKVNKATEKNIENILQEVTDFVIETNIKSLQKKVDGVLNGKYQAVENGRLKPKKIVDEVRKRIDKIKSNLVGPKATAEQIGEVNMKLLDRFNELAQEPQQTVEQREEMVDLQLAMQYNNAMLMENSNPNKVTELDGIYSTLEEMITFGRSLLQEELLRQHQYYNEQFEQGYEAITGDKVDMSDPDAKSQLNNRKKQRASDLKRKKATQNVVRTFFSNMFTKIGNYTFGSAEAMDGLMDRIDKLPGKMFGGRLNEMFTDRIDESSRRFKMRMMEVESIIAGYLYEAYGKKWKKVSRENRIQKDLGIELHDGIMLEPISQDQIAYLYNMYKDPANRVSFSNPKMWGVEVINREDSASEKKRKQKANEANAARVMKELETQLDPKVKEVADWQVEVLYPALYEEYNKTYKKLYRTDLPWNKFYAGTIYRDGVPESEIDVINLLGQGNMYKTAVGAGATKVRQNSSLPIQAMNMMDVLNTYINDMEYFAAYGEAIRDMDKFFSNEYVKGAIGDIHGNEIYTFVKDMIQKVASQGQQTGIRAKIINGMNNVFILSRLALSPVITIKQLTSTFTYMNDIGPVNWLKYAAKNKTQQLKVWKEVTKNSVYMKDRNNQSIMRAIETYTDAKMKEFVPRPTKDWLINFAMYTTKLGDRGAIMLGGLPNYSYYKAQALKQGKTEQEAIDIAIIKFEKDTKRTQQSADLQDKDYLQTGDPITRAMNMFLTTPKQYLRKEIIATRNLYRAMSGQAYKGTVAQNVRTFLMYHVFMPVLFQYVSMGLPGILRGFRDDDEEDLLRAGVIGNLNALFIIGEVVQTAADAFTDKPWAGSQAKTVGLIQIANGIARDFMKAGKYKDEEKKAKAYRDAYLELSTLTGLPMPTIAKFFDNYSKMGDEADLGKMIMRLLNYSNYQIEGPNKKGSGKSEGTMDDFYKKIQKEKEKKAREDKKKAAGFNSSGGFNNAGFKNNSFDSKGFEGGFD